MILIMVSIHYIPKETCLMAYKNHLHNPHCHFKLLVTVTFTQCGAYSGRDLSWSHEATVFYDTFNLKQNNTYEVTAAIWAVLGNSSIEISCLPKQHNEFQWIHSSSCLHAVTTSSSLIKFHIFSCMLWFGSLLFSCWGLPQAVHTNVEQMDLLEWTFISELTLIVQYHTWVR